MSSSNRCWSEGIEQCPSKLAPLYAYVDEGVEEVGPVDTQLGEATPLDIETTTAVGGESR